ncbi:TetR family transcriptional regulator [Actinocorallia herbida]|uniref:TetR family transcriptional regulator n=1 Tax=Actinocorallia herbida TaxID=58109 RepID=A0A3N1CVZ8_9ACTN|nr:TetR/AcrR family transcriptional regulator [Actinocorallia herbida]ROO85457.1 TetR family transcriptional regulator [Actinocorallia herbida]
MGARKRLSGPERRAQILDVTRALVVGEGYHAVGIERVAEACGVTRTVIYQQFTSLPGLLVALIDREVDLAFAGFRKAAARPVPEGEDPFTWALAGILEAVAAAPDTWRLFLLPAEGGPPALHERLAQARAVTRASLQPLTAQHPDPALAGRVLHAVADELVRLHLTEPDTYPVDRLLAQARPLARAIRAPA